MKILVLHDRDEILEEIRAIILENVDGADDIDVSKDAATAHHFLSQKQYDLLIADLTIPHHPDGQNDSFEAIESLLLQIFRFGTLNPPTDVIGITRDSEAIDLFNNQIGRHLMCVIPEQENGAWRKELAERICYAQQSMGTRAINSMNHFRTDVVIVTALDEEAAPFRDIYELNEDPRLEGASTFKFEDRDGNLRIGVVYSVGKAGQPSIASATQMLIWHYRPKLILMSGICGGVRGKVEIGDLIFCSSAFAWDHGKWIDKEGAPDIEDLFFLSRPDPVSIEGSQSLNAARRFADSEYKDALFSEMRSYFNIPTSQGLDTNIHIKSIGSGSAVVASASVLDRIRQLSDNIWAIDMECFGFYLSSTMAYGAKPCFLTIKSVCDFSDAEKDDSYHKFCAQLAGAAVARYLQGYFRFDAQS